MTTRRLPQMLPAPDPVRGEDWRARAACLGHPFMDSLWFANPSDRENVSAARAICRTCPVAAQCLETALSMPKVEGIWGGTSASQRSRIRQKRAKGKEPKPTPAPALPAIHKCPLCPSAFPTFRGAAAHWGKVHRRDTGTCIAGHPWPGGRECVPCRRGRRLRRRAELDALREAS